MNSPRWSFYSQKYNNYSGIGSDDRLTGNWDFVINRATCPPRLLNPDRVSRELPATLVISSVTTADNGIYICTLLLRAYNPISHQVQLVVTVTPNFKAKSPLTQNVAEGQELNLPCTAIGPPAPNITWVQKVGHVIMSKGIGSATLTIPNITRHQNGTYECQARNNPNENPVFTRTVVTVYYKPAINVAKSSLFYNSWNGKSICMRCMAAGLPSPRISWYKPTNHEINTGVTTLSGGSELAMETTGNPGDYGQYKCRATNRVGTDEHFINVTQLFPPGHVTITITDIEASYIAVSWTKPAYDGGRVITGYLLEVNTRPSVLTTDTHAVITGLKADIHYTIKVYAWNDVGYGVVSSTVIRTNGTGKPSAPELLASMLRTIGSEFLVLLRWTKPDDNGADITRYRIYSKDATRQSDWTRIDDVHDPYQLDYKVMRNIVYGKTYKFIVTAWNRYGESVKDDRNAKIVNTTAKGTYGSGIGKSTNYHNERISKYAASTIIGVISAVLVVSVILNIVLTIWNKVKSNDTDKRLPNKRKQTNKVVNKEVYDNDLEMVVRRMSGDTAPLSQRPTQMGPIYETIHQPNEETNANETCTSSDPSQYQGLNLPANTSAQGEGAGPVYEPLRTKLLQSTTRLDNNGQHPYEPLDITNQSSNYQSLHISSTESAI